MTKRKTARRRKSWSEKENFYLRLPVIRFILTLDSLISVNRLIVNQFEAYHLVRILLRISLNSGLNDNSCFQNLYDKNY